jgi:hypothetical protein
MPDTFSDPVAEQIRRSILADIDDIKIANGRRFNCYAFEYDANSDLLLPPPTTGNREVGIIVELGDDEEVYDGVPVQEYIQRFELRACVNQEEAVRDSADAGDTTPTPPPLGQNSQSLDRRLIQLRADLRKKLCRDNEGRGGLAITTKIRNSEPISDGAGLNGLRLTVEVAYQIERNNEDAGA